MYAPARTHAPFQGLLAVGALLGAGAAPEELYAAVAASVAGALGFRTVAVNVHRPADDELAVELVHGSAETRAALEGTVSQEADWAALLDPAHEVSGAFFVPAGAVDWQNAGPAYWVPDLPEPLDPGAWSPHDALLVPLRTGGGELLGVLSVDEPEDGRRPGPEECGLLGAYGAHLSQALESWRRGQEQRLQREALERLAEVSAAAWRSVEAAPVAAAVAQAAGEALGWEEVEVAVRRDGRLATLAGPARLDGYPADAAAALLTIGEEREGCRLLAACAAPQAWGPPLGVGQGRRGWREHAVLVPLADRSGRLAGLLRAAGPAERTQPPPGRLRLLSAFAAQAAAALDSAASAALRESEARKAAVLAAALDAVVTLDHTGRLLEVNPAALDMFGFARNEVLGRHVSDILAPPARREEHRATVMGYLRALAAGRREGERVQTSARRANGDRFPCELAVRRIAADGAPLFTAYLRDVSDRVAAQRGLEEERDRARHAALHDALTGLPNRTAVEQRLAALDLAQAAPVVALVVDLDDFQLVNVSLGHVAGDELLRAVAERFASAAGPDALLARLGGDGFVLVLEGVPDAAGAAAALRAALEAPFEVAGIELPVQATLGTALARTPEEVRSLLRRADIARARAKAAGVAMLAFAAEHDDASRRLGLATGLRRAIERDELELHFQPLVALAEDRLAGVEALVRWRRPDGSLVPPAEFIPFAETSGLIEPLGAWVIDRAAAQAAAWPGVVVGVNVSPRQLQAGDPARTIAEALARHGVAPDRFAVEITETALRGGEERVARNLEAIRALGVRLALDDFGADYSSLARLRESPVETVKLDRSFLAGVPEDPKAWRLLSAIAGLVHALGLRCVVEGIETPAQRAAVRELGVAFGQGYGLGRPVPAAELDALIAAARPA